MADDDGSEVERIAAEATGEAHEGSPSTTDVPKCPQCHRPLDDIEGMGESQLLGFLRLHTLRELARSAQSGQMTHQELAVTRGLLRDNLQALKPLKPDKKPGPDELHEDDDALPERGAGSTPLRRPRPSFEDTDA